ncbi:hypothetical protein [Aeromonas caviae]|jgi:hypothetical protein|uniref:hypothetical protein n=1 Tax=Aeromonas caviae TaxID=648 RepID=UPI002B4A1793|nr:hypothetical protein [Aeromonas caviae]
MALDTVLPGQTVAGEGRSESVRNWKLEAGSWKLEAGPMMGRFLYDMVDQDQ